MSFALFQIPEVQQLITYLEGNGGDLSGHILDVPYDYCIDGDTVEESDFIKDKVNYCLRAAYNDYHNVGYDSTPEHLDTIGDAIVIDLITDARKHIQQCTASLHRCGYIVSTHSYPLVVSNAGDTLIEVIEHGKL